MAIAVTYFACKELVVNGETREIGSLVPEARDWPGVSVYVDNGEIARILVATLPKAARDFLDDWEVEDEQRKIDQRAAVKAQEEAWEQGRQDKAKLLTKDAYADPEAYAAPYVPILTDQEDEQGHIDITDEIENHPLLPGTPAPEDLEKVIDPADVDDSDEETGEDPEDESDEDIEDEEPEEAPVAKRVIKAPARKPVQKKEKVNA